ncbi:hypothetical protein [Candidatus Clostridium helianthi]|uniref:Uncharacterized protein n=1 Tax=Candidatus Clostridium helianthi TaxID=3381660 RepID=A0ABW8S7I7_9CLOT
MTTEKVVAIIETGKGAHGAVVGPDNKYVYNTYISSYNLHITLL